MVATGMAANLQRTKRGIYGGGGGGYGGGGYGGGGYGGGGGGGWDSGPQVHHEHVRTVHVPQPYPV